MSYLGQNIFPIPIELQRTALDWWETERVKKLVPEFPAVFDKAVRDWAHFKAGVQAGLFTAEQKQTALDWFREFPRLWETIRPNFIQDAAGKEWGGQVDNFIGSMKREPLFTTGIGIAPAIVAGVLIVGGIAASLWAVSYIQEQNNISTMIENVVAGRLPASVLNNALEKEKSSTFGDIANVIKWAAVIGAALYFGPVVINAVKGRGR